MTATEESAPKLLYIMGTARSGSTMLEILLADNREVVGAGELAHFFQDALIDDHPCSCGHNVERCTQWEAVYRGFADERPGWLGYARLFHAVEWHVGFWRTLLGVARDRLKRYGDLNRRLITMLARRGESEWVVDSSKYAGRALALHEVFRDRLWVICLTRSPQDLVRSFMKKNREEQKPKSLPRVVAYYLYAALCLRVASWRLRRRVIFLSYENLVADPEECLERIERWCGIRLEQARQKLENDAWLDVGHIVTGNRLRKKGRARFRRQIETARPLTTTQRVAVGLMNGYGRLLGLRP